MFTGMNVYLLTLFMLLTPDVKVGVFNDYAACAIAGDEIVIAIHNTVPNSGKHVHYGCSLVSLEK
jgi:hypothetical protein